MWQLLDPASDGSGYRRFMNKYSVVFLKFFPRAGAGRPNKSHLATAVQDLWRKFEKAQKLSSVFEGRSKGSYKQTWEKAKKKMKYCI